MKGGKRRLSSDSRVTTSGGITPNGTRMFFCSLTSRWRKTRCGHNTCAIANYRSMTGKEPRDPGSKASVKPKLTVDEIRAKLGDFKKVDSVEVPLSSLTGNLEEVIKSLKRRLSNSNLEKPKLVKRMVSQGRYRNSTEKWLIEGERDYTDAELEAEGMRLIAKVDRERAKREAERLKKVEQFNRLAGDLGLDERKVTV